MFKTITLASLQAYLAMATDESTCLEEGGKWITDPRRGDRCVDTFQDLCRRKKDYKWDSAKEACLSKQERMIACQESGGKWQDDGVYVWCEEIQSTQAERRQCYLPYGRPPYKAWDYDADTCVDAWVKDGQTEEDYLAQAEKCTDGSFDENNLFVQYWNVRLNSCVVMSEVDIDCYNVQKSWNWLTEECDVKTEERIFCEKHVNGVILDGKCIIMNEAEITQNALQYAYSGATETSEYTCIPFNNRAKVDDQVVAMSLAQADAQTESNNQRNAFAAGAAFGVVGLAATLFLISTCSKKKVSERQSALLDGNQSANHL